MASPNDLSNLANVPLAEAVEIVDAHPPEGFNTDMLRRGFHYDTATGTWLNSHDAYVASEAGSLTSIYEQVLERAIERRPSNTQLHALIRDNRHLLERISIFDGNIAQLRADLAIFPSDREITLDETTALGRAGPHVFSQDYFSILDDMRPLPLHQLSLISSAYAEYYNEQHDSNEQVSGNEQGTDVEQGRRDHGLPSHFNMAFPITPPTYLSPDNTTNDNETFTNIINFVCMTTQAFIHIGARTIALAPFDNQYVVPRSWPTNRAEMMPVNCAFNLALVHENLERVVVNVVGGESAIHSTLDNFIIALMLCSPLL